jgi:hypothetical protein
MAMTTATDELRKEQSKLTDSLRLETEAREALAQDGFITKSRLASIEKRVDVQTEELRFTKRLAETMAPIDEGIKESLLAFVEMKSKFKDLQASVERTDMLYENADA